MIRTARPARFILESMISHIGMRSTIKQTKESRYALHSRSDEKSTTRAAVIRECRSSSHFCPLPQRQRADASLDRWRGEWGGAVRGLRYSVRVLDKLSRRFDKPLTLRE